MSDSGGYDRVCTNDEGTWVVAQGHVTAPQPWSGEDGRVKQRKRDEREPEAQVLEFSVGSLLLRQSLY